jgi:PAS domain S-box-containing protein
MYDMLAEVSRLLTSLSALEIDECLPRVLGMIGGAVAADRVLVYTFTDTPGELLITHRWSAQPLPASVPPPSTLTLPKTCESLAHGCEILVTDPGELPPDAVHERMAMERMHIQTLMILPLRTGDTITGGIQVSSQEAPGEWLQEITTFLRITADLLSGLFTRSDKALRLLKAEARWRLAIEAYGEGLWDLDIETKHMWVSDRYLAILGMQRDTVPEDSNALAEAIHPDDREAFIQSGDRLVAACAADPAYTDVTFMIETRMRQGDGSYRLIRHRGMVAERAADGRALRIVGTIIDITEERKKENLIARQALDLHRTVAALEEAVRVKDDFLTTMSHELRTPLTSIISPAELLQMMPGTMSAKQLHFVEMIHTHAQHLRDLITNVLDVARLQEGSLTIDLAPVDLLPSAENALRAVRAKAEQRRQVLTLSCTLDTPTVRAHARRLEQLLVHLLDNAVKYTPDEGRIDLIVEADPDDAWLRISVRDTGIGIDSADLPRLFLPFVRLDSSTTRTTGGTGLGLTLTRRLVELHHGTIDVDSTPGLGTTFTIRLPRHKK